MIFHKDRFQPSPISRQDITQFHSILFMSAVMWYTWFARTIKNLKGLPLIIHFSFWKKVIFKQPFADLMPKIDAMKKKGLYFKEYRCFYYKY